MNNETSKRYSLTEIGLLAFFVLGLIAAQMLVKARQRIVLSEPVSLAGSGLSVCKPISTGWESTSTWQYESDNSFTLVAQQFQGTRREVEIRWRYLLCSRAESSRQILEDRAERASAVFGEIQTLQQPVPMDYAAIHSADGSRRTFYVGIAKLDFGRSIELQVLPRRVDLFYAENLFTQLASSLQYQFPDPLQAGQDVVAGLWENLQQDTVSATGSDQDIFIINNTQKQPVGYSYSHYSPGGDDTNRSLSITNRYYELNQFLLDSTLMINNEDKTFLWKSSIQGIGMGQPRSYTITKDADGMLDVKTDFDADQNRQYRASCLLVPELLLPQAAKLVLDHSLETVIVDVMSARGFVVPTVLSKSDPATALARSEDIAAVVKVDFLNHPKSFEELYFDKDGRLIARLEQQPLKRPRLWEMTTLNQLQQIFKESFQSKTETVARID